jgi:hypothetical protein
MFYKSSLESCGQDCSDIDRAFECFMNLPRIPIRLLTSDAFSVMDIGLTVGRCRYKLEFAQSSLGGTAWSERRRDFSSHIESGNYVFILYHHV